MVQAFFHERHSSCNEMYLPFTQSRLRLLGQKNNLDGELLLLAILRMSNVVRQAPSLWRLFFHPPLPPHPPFVQGKSFPFRRMSFFMQRPAPEKQIYFIAGGMCFSNRGCICGRMWARRGICIRLRGHLWRELRENCGVM